MHIKKVFCSGEVKFKQVTPIFEALFSCYAGLGLSESQGKSFLISPANWPSPTWQQVKDNLISLVERLGLSLPENSEGTFHEYILVLAKHFGVENTLGIEILEAYPFTLDGMPDMQILYGLAENFNDGHNISGIDFHCIWYNEKGEFGGYIVYITDEINFYHHLYDDYSSAKFEGYLLSQNNLKRASETMFAEVKHLLSHIQDQNKRSLIQSMIIDQMIDDVSLNTPPTDE